MVGWLPASHLSLPGSSNPPCHSLTGICRAKKATLQAQRYWSGALQHHSRHFCAGGRGGQMGGGVEAWSKLNQAKQAMIFVAIFCPQMDICFFLFLRFFWCVEFLIARVCTLVVIACVKHLVTPKRSFVFPHALAIRCPAGHSQWCKVCTLLTATLSLCNLATQLTSGTPNISQQVEVGIIHSPYTCKSLEDMVLLMASWIHGRKLSKVQCAKHIKSYLYWYT